MRRGFTLVEILFTIGLLTVIFSLTLQIHSTFQQTLWQRGARQIQQVISSAAEHARGGVGGTSWGVYFSYDETSREANRAIVFAGNNYATRDATKDIAFDLNPNLHLTTVSLSGPNPSDGNDHEVVFSFLSGVTTQYGSITITAHNTTTQITIPPTGIPVRP